MRLPPRVRGQQSTRLCRLKVGSSSQRASSVRVIWKRSEVRGQRSEVSKARGCAALRSEITLAGVGVFVQSAGAGHHGGSQGRYTQWCAKAARVSAWFLWFGDEGFGEGGGDVVYPVWKIAFFLAPKAGPRWRHKLETRATTASTHENQAHPCETPRADIDGCQAQIAT